MSNIRNVPLPVVWGLGSLALVRPLVRIIDDQADLFSGPAVPLILTGAISVIWIAVVGCTRVAEPFLTLLFAGVTYGVLSIVLSAALSPVLQGQLDGPLAHPVAIVPVLLVNAVWGAAAGALAVLVRRARDARAEGDPTPRA